jgi:lysophospholipase L1-like esterase
MGGGGRRAAITAVALLVLVAGTRLPAAAAGESGYAALGDSYSAGIGTGGEDGSDCRRSANAYPPRFSQASHRYVLTDFAACTGATISDVQRLQLGSIAPAGLVSITVGGNDARFGEIIVDCLRPGSGCRRDYPDEDARIDSLEAPLHALYTQIVTTAASAGLEVLTYPQIFRDGGVCRSTWSFTADDVAWFRSEYSHMNRVIRAAADGVPRLHVLDVENAFAGHEVCTAQPWANGGSWRDPYSSFHPNILGHAALAAALGADAG